MIQESITNGGVAGGKLERKRGWKRIREPLNKEEVKENKICQKGARRQGFTDTEKWMRRNMD